MTFEEAFLKSAQYYFKGKDFAETNKAQPNRKYTKKYFDAFEKEINPDVEDIEDDLPEVIKRKKERK